MHCLITVWLSKQLLAAELGTGGQTGTIDNVVVSQMMAG